MNTMKQYILPSRNSWSKVFCIVDKKDEGLRVLYLWLMMVIFSPFHDALRNLLVCRHFTVDEDYSDNFISDISEVFEDFKETTPALSLNVSVNQSGLYIKYIR